MNQRKNIWVMRAALKTTSRLLTRVILRTIVFGSFVPSAGWLHIFGCKIWLGWRLYRACSHVFAATWYRKDCDFQQGSVKDWSPKWRRKRYYEHVPEERREDDRSIVSSIGLDSIEYLDVLGSMAEFPHEAINGSGYSCGRVLVRWCLIRALLLLQLFLMH